MGEAGVEAERGQQQADAVGAEHADETRLAGIEHRLLLRGIEPGSDDDDGAAALRGQLAHNSRHRRSRCCDDTEVGGLGQRGDRGMAGDAADLVIVRVDELQTPTETGREIVRDCAAHGAYAVGRADEDHGLRGHHRVEIANCHLSLRSGRGASSRANLCRDPTFPGLDGRQRPLSHQRLVSFSSMRRLRRSISSLVPFSSGWNSP